MIHQVIERSRDVRHCDLEESTSARDGKGREFESWQCLIMIYHVHRARDSQVPPGFSEYIYGLIQKIFNCVVKLRKYPLRLVFSHCYIIGYSQSTSYHTYSVQV